RLEKIGPPDAPRGRGPTGRDCTDRPMRYQQSRRTFRSRGGRVEVLQQDLQPHAPPDRLDEASPFETMRGHLAPFRLPCWLGGRGPVGQSKILAGGQEDSREPQLWVRRVVAAGNHGRRHPGAWTALVIGKNEPVRMAAVVVRRYVENIL